MCGLSLGPKPWLGLSLEGPMACLEGPIACLEGPTAWPQLGPGLGCGFLEKVSKCCVLSWLTFTRRLNNIKSELGGTQTMVMARNK